VQYVECKIGILLLPQYVFLV